MPRCNCTDPAGCHDPESHGHLQYRCPGCGGLTPKKKSLCLDCLLGQADENDEPAGHRHDTREESRWEV